MALARTFVESLLGTLSPPSPSRPFLTLTFAQSLDAKIAGIGGQQLALSCSESMVMTHWLRSKHDGILVGIGTAMNDNPQLNSAKSLEFFAIAADIRQPDTSPRQISVIYQDRSSSIPSSASTPTANSSPITALETAGGPTSMLPSPILPILSGLRAASRSRLPAPGYSQCLSETICCSFLQCSDRSAIMA